MSISNLNIHHLRNISSARLTLHPQYNIFSGANGSGKTSLLEAIYLLGSGHSFRTREISTLISHEEQSLTVFARMASDESISIQKNRLGVTQVKLNQQFCKRSSELAHFLPCQVFYQDIFQIIDAGPMLRRGLLDWGMFHVKHSYHDLWKDYRRVLKQRNALLRQRANKTLCLPWDTMLADLATTIDKLRCDYFEQWSAVFQSYLAQLTDVSCSIHYYKGWDRKNTGKSLATILEEQFTSDSQQQYTHSGAHQADILFDSASVNAKKILSRGQQKVVLIALKLAQAQILSVPCVYLLDDIAAELDGCHLERFSNCLSLLKGQFFITSIDSSKLPSMKQFKNANRFSLERGTLSQEA